MRKLVVAEFLTLDGVMEEPSWTGTYQNEEIAAFKHAELFASEALLLGRVTYDGFAAAWPSSTDEQGFADRMNGLPKFVVSGTLGEAAWSNSTVLRENVADEVARLKAQEGKDILVYGSGQLVRSLLAHGLVDQLNLLIFPVVLGRGKRLFGDGGVADLTLAGSQAFSSGVVRLTYTLGGRP